MLYIDDVMFLITILFPTVLWITIKYFDIFVNRFAKPHSWLSNRTERHYSILLQKKIPF